MATQLWSLIAVHLIISLLCSLSAGQEYVPACGISTIRPERPSRLGEIDARIVGGSQVTWGQIPWQVAITMFGTAFCGGTILNDRWILTAAHCVHPENINGKDVSIYVGDLITTEFDPDHEAFDREEFKIEKVIIYPHFNKKQLLFDIALVKLKGRIQWSVSNEQIRPVCLPRPGDNSVDEVSNRYTAMVSGWGKTHSSAFTGSAALRYVQMPIITRRECQTWFSLKNPPTRVIIRNENICAGFHKGGHDACQGDSGGPMVVFKDGVWQLYGIISGGFGCADASSPGIFTRVSSYLGWIHEQMARN